MRGGERAHLEDTARKSHEHVPAERRNVVPCSRGNERARGRGTTMGRRGMGGEKAGVWQGMRDEAASRTQSLAGKSDSSTG